METVVRMPELNHKILPLLKQCTEPNKNIQMSKNFVQILCSIAFLKILKWQSIDEIMMLQFIRGKPIRYRYRMWSLYDYSGHLK